MIKIIGLIAAVIMPFWNIPLIVRIAKRKSSKDISLFWAFGVFVCLILMFPSALASKDIVFKTYSIVNIIFFSLVVIQTLRYR
ncbi:MAG: hypothetical protein PHS93_07035 [Candidatus Omnitrophica bacterium]|nr:hypothetical protein [Candidatus Omnitrophota bacterium]MDD5352896.1 hypothetical protein [Candidatus Omnitrophota bacterium]MDD5550495.1 hypothetical protein [Candidatus Omnitrophota bacterium]